MSNFSPAFRKKITNCFLSECHAVSKVSNIQIYTGTIDTIVCNLLNKTFFSALYAYTISLQMPSKPSSQPVKKSIVAFFLREAMPINNCSPEFLNLWAKFCSNMTNFPVAMDSTSPLQSQHQGTNSHVYF